MMNLLSSWFGGSSPTQLTTSSSDGFVGTTKYIDNKLGKFQEGLSFIITGTINQTGERFIIDFALEDSAKDIPLRLNAVVAENIVIRNSKVNNSWGHEETSTEIPFAFEAGSLFQIEVLFTNVSIMMAVDGFHIGKFEHRLPFNDIHSLMIKGDITDIHVKRKIVTAYPHRTKKSKHFVSIADRVPNSTGGVDYTSCDENYVQTVLEANKQRRPMPLPYYASFPKAFFETGFKITIKGQVKEDAHAFSASLQTGQHIWPQPDVTLFIEFRFTPQSDGETGEPLVLRKSYFNQHWSKETISELDTGLRPGADFELIIIRGSESYEILMNSKSLTEYRYMLNPMNVNTCLVAGDLLLFSIEIKENA